MTKKTTPKRAVPTDTVRLKQINPGMYVRTLANPGAVYIVTENDGNRLLAVAAVQVVAPLKFWEVLDARDDFPTFKPIRK